MEQKNGHKTRVVVAQDESGSRLDHYLKRLLPGVSFTSFAKLVRKGDIRVNGSKIEISVRVTPGDQITFPAFLLKTEKNQGETETFPLSQADRARIQLWILFEDDEIVALNKPAGLAVQGGSHQKTSLDAMLVAYYNQKVTPRLVHRLDKETSGVLVVAKTLPMTKHLGEVFRHHEAQKTYYALTEGPLRCKDGSYTTLLDKKSGDDSEGVLAETHIKTIDFAPKTSLVELSPKTGRTHQLRLHLKEMGTPILGDDKYGSSRPFLKEENLERTLYLHASSLRIPLPNGKKVLFEAPFPDHFEKALRHFGLVIMDTSERASPRRRR